VAKGRLPQAPERRQPDRLQRPRCRSLAIQHRRPL